MQVQKSMVDLKHHLQLRGADGSGPGTAAGTPPTGRVDDAANAEQLKAAMRARLEEDEVSPDGSPAFSCVCVLEEFALATWSPQSMHDAMA